MKSSAERDIVTTGTPCNHAIGHIGQKTIYMSDDWDTEVTAFEAVIDDFNIRGGETKLTIQDGVPHSTFALTAELPLSTWNGTHLTGKVKFDYSVYIANKAYF